MRYFKITALLNGLEDLLQKNKALVVKKGQQRLELTPDKHNLPMDKISKYAVKVIKRLKQAGYEAYLVGGGVRDLLLGKSPKDFDVSTNATPEQVRRLFSNSRIIGRRFKIVHIIYGDDIIEVTTFRGGNSNVLTVQNAISREGKRYEVQANQDGMLVRDNSYGKHIEEDAQRRDFTINAIYLDIQTGKLIDFHGGLYDLTKGVIDIIGDPDTRYREDPVRILRAARFSAKLGFKISHRTLASIEPCAGLLASVSTSRMYDEVNKLFLTGHAQASFKVLTSLNLFNRLFKIPEMLLSSSVCRDFLNHAFASTDQRFKENKRNMPHFLYAIVLWNPFIWSFYRNREEMMTLVNNVNYREVISSIAVNVVTAQDDITAMPEQVVRSIVLLWRLQFLLEAKNPEKYVKETTSYASFRAAFDLFKLRANFDKNLQERVAFWEPYYNQCKADAERRKAEVDRRRRRSSNNEERRPRGGADRFERGGHRGSKKDVMGDNNAQARQKTIDKARAWRESMNLKP